MTQALLTCAVASLQTGKLLQPTNTTEGSGPLEELAATLPEVFGALDTGCLERIASRLGSEPTEGMFAEVVLLSASNTHVIQPLPSRPGQALLAIAPAARSVGLVLSQVHAHAATLEQEA